jgi:hypothetical protein
MNLPPEDRSKLKRLSPLGLELPAPKVVIEPFEGDNSPSEEETVYNKIIAINPLFKELVSDFDLVSSRTGAQIREVKILYQLRIVETVSINQLLAIARRILGEKDSYTKEEVITKLTVEVKVNQERAKKVFYMMVHAEIIEATPGGKYILIK